MVRNLLVHDELHGAQHGAVFTLGVNQPFRVALGHVDDRLHEHDRAVAEALQSVAISLEVLDRAGGDTAVHRGFRDGDGYFFHQARVERLRNQVVRAERQALALVGIGNFVG